MTSGPPDRDDGLWRELEALAVTVAAEAAALLREGLGRRDGDGRRGAVASSTKTSATDLVTEYDQASERLVVERLLAARPHDGVVGEEGTDIAGTSGVRWVIDPLDGTTNFVYGHPGCNVSIAAEVDGIGVVAGAVHDPLIGDRYAARLGGGAHRNGVAIRCNPAPPMAAALVGTGFSYDPARRERQARVLVEVLPRVRDVRRMGAAAIDLCSVASGRLDAFYERGLQPWDYAAGALVATEAGALVGDLDGNPTSTAFTLAAPAALFAVLVPLLRSAGAAEA